MFEASQHRMLSRKAGLSTALSAIYAHLGDIIKLMPAGREEQVIQDFKEKLLNKFGGAIELIQLFGSRARGDARPDSDIDILVVLKRPQEDQISFIYDTAMQLSGEYELYPSVKIFSKKEFDYYKSVPTMFIDNVLREGIKLA